MNQFGKLFTLSIFGESHGEAVGVTLDGVPAGLALSEKSFAADLARRKSGARGTTPRKESDRPQILSGLYNGRTTGAPLTIIFRNENTRSGDYASLTTHPRPSHADWVAGEKFRGFQDPRGGGHFSGRLTLALVAAGVVAKKILKRKARGFSLEASLTAVGKCTDRAGFDSEIEQALKAGDSVGGLIECRASGIPVGWGEPFFDSAESLIAHALFSIPAVKGVEFGAGFGAACMRGSSHNDPIISMDGTTATNHAGGIVGGITNGNEIIVRAAVKPTPSIAFEQVTLDKRSGRPEPLTIRGRHDACIALRAPVVVEAAVAVALCDLALRAKAGRL